MWKHRSVTFPWALINRIFFCFTWGFIYTTKYTSMYLCVLCAWVQPEQAFAIWPWSVQSWVYNLWGVKPFYEEGCPPSTIHCHPKGHRRNLVLQSFIFQFKMLRYYCYWAFVEPSHKKKKKVSIFFHIAKNFHDANIRKDLDA